MPPGALLYTVCGALQPSGRDAQAVECAGQIALGDLVLLPAFFLEDDLPCLVGLPLGADGVDLLRTLNGVHQNDHLVFLHLDHAGGDGRDLRFPVRDLIAQGSRLYGGDHGAVVGPDAQLPVAGGDGQADAGALIEGLVRRQNVYLKGVHQISPASSFRAFSTTSRQEPTL